MDNDRAEVVEKIQKLLALANSSNEFEAKLAADKASELLTRHNLKLQDVTGYESQQCRARYTQGKDRKTLEQKWIFQILTKYFFVKIVSGFGIDRNTMRKMHVWSVFGDKHNVEIAEYVFKFLNVTYQNLFKEYRKVTGCPSNYRDSYYTGLTCGIIEQMDAMRAKVQNETGLMVIPDPKIDDFIEQTVGKVRSRSLSVNIRNDEAANQGLEDGKKIRINKGLSESDKKEKIA